ncbi:MAG: lysoplasmalogenase [Rhodobacteraceae bacterium]|nr:lysoplasmalogenase [Paracoccaceae bacterium]
MSLGGPSALVFLAGVLALIYLLGFCYRSVSWPKTLVKTTSILLLALVAWQVSASNWLVLALGLCALGDLLLSRDDARSFLAGVGSFAAGHLAYITLFLSHDLAQPVMIVEPPQLYVAIALILLSVVLALVLMPRAGDLRSAILAYIPIITGMGIVALALPDVGLLLPGALLFVVSDLVLALEMFVFAAHSAARRFTPFVVWATYWAAQFLLFSALT